MYWGWNRGWFSNSDIHFTEDEYDFTLYDVKGLHNQFKKQNNPVLITMNKNLY